MDKFKAFGKKMVSCKISNVLRCLSDNAKGGVLSTSNKVTIKGKKRTVLDLLQEKHPCSQKAAPKYVVTDLRNWDLPFHPSIFEKINGSEIKRAAMKINGSHDPSGLDAGEWRQLLTYKSSSIDLCKTVSKLAIRVATEELNFLNSYNACRLIALGKCPGVRPVGIGEVFRRIMGRIIVKCVKRDLQLPGETYRCALDIRVASNMLSMHSGSAKFHLIT